MASGSGNQLGQRHHPRMTNFAAAVGFVLERDPLEKSMYSTSDKPWYEEFRGTPFYPDAIRCERDMIQDMAEARRQSARLREEQDRKRKAFYRDNAEDLVYAPIAKVQDKHKARREALQIKRLEWEEEAAKSEASGLSKSHTGTMGALVETMQHWRP